MASYKMVGLVHAKRREKRNKSIFYWWKVAQVINAPDQYKTHEKWNKVVSKEPVMSKFCPDRYKTQKMCDEAVDARLSALSLFLIGFLWVNCLK